MRVELTRAHTLGLLTPSGRPVSTLEELLHPDTVSRYLDAGDSGALRTRNAGNRAPSQASAQVRRSCLRQIAALARVPDPLPDRRDQVPLKVPVDTAQRWRTFRLLADHCPDRRPALVRLHAVLGVVLDTSARSGELCELDVEDLGPELAWVDVTRHPQAYRGPISPRRERIALSIGTREAVARWLRLRATLTSHLEDPSTALWVTVAANHRGGSRHPSGTSRRSAGVPLQPGGMQRSYATLVDKLNFELGGTVGWDPLPVRMEQLRRGVQPHVLAVLPATPQQAVHRACVLTSRHSLPGPMPWTECSPIDATSAFIQLRGAADQV